MNTTIVPVITRVSRWDGVETDRTRDAVTFRIDDRALARIAANGTLTVPTTPPLRNQLLTDGFADSLPRRRDCVSYRVRSPADVAGAIRLLRVAYLHHQRQTASPQTVLDTRDDHIRRLDASSELLALLSAPTVETDHERRIA